VPTTPKAAKHVEEMQPIATGLQKWTKYLPKVRAAAGAAPGAIIPSLC
jgi:hypothetical protein